VGRFVQDTTATPTAWFWIEKDLGSATATITPPFTRNPGVGFNAPTYATIASGDSLVLYDETQADCAYVAQPWADSFGPPQVDNLWCANTLTTSIGAYWYEDRFSSEVRGVTGAWPSMVAGNDFFDSVSSFQAPSFIVWGGAIDSTFTTIGNTQGASNDSLVLDADVILAGGGGEAFHMQGGVTIGRAYLGSGPDTDACQNGAIMLGTYDSAGVYYADAELYGPAGLDLHDGCTFQCERSGCTGRLLITGGLTVEGEASSYPWGVASHAWGAPVAITAANIDSSGAIGDPSTGNFFRQ
jgi:hypothetical protein